MIIKKDASKIYERLFVQSSIFLDNYAGIFGLPFITLAAYKDVILEWYGPYEIYMHVCDYDDFDYGCVYKMQNEEEFFDVLHELINWMRDHEHGITYWDDIVNGNLFPEFRNVDKEPW